MKTIKQSWKGLLTALCIGMAVVAVPDPVLAQEEGKDEMEVLTRGPVHEAFAETVVYDPEPGIIVPKQPPELIEEVQPDQRPVGTNVTWIPGYWAWEDDDSDFFWISGVWRNLPPGREWVPGYWSPVENSSYQWTSGYWEDAEAQEVAYLPPPPKSLEKGPNVEAASDNQVWIPGTWQYRDDSYAWRAGYWVDARPNYAWTPAYYRWTPRGHVYVDGYWDYPVVNRGVVFAPVRFHRPAYYQRPDYYYTPATVISLAVFTNHLFVRPRYGHYYFGDYYDAGYRDRYYASYDYGRRYRGYDPIYVHSRWEHRHDRNWERQRREYFEYRRDNIGSRPPRTWAAYNRLPERDREREEFRMASRLDRMAGDRDGRIRFQKVDDNERQRFNTQRKAIREFGRERAQRERTGQKARADGEGRGPVAREKVKRSPVAAKRDNRDEKAGGPPPRLQRREADAGKGEKGNRGEAAAADRNPKKDREERTAPGQRRDEDSGRKGDGNRGQAKKNGDENNADNRGQNRDGGNRPQPDEGNRGNDANRGEQNREGGDRNKNNNGGNANKGGNRPDQGDGGRKISPNKSGGEKKASPNQEGGNKEFQGGQGGGQKNSPSNQGGEKKGGEKKAAPAKKTEASQPKRQSAPKRESDQAQQRKQQQQAPQQAKKQPQQAKKQSQPSPQKTRPQANQQRKAQDSPKGQGGGEKKSSGDGGGKKEGGKKDKD